MDEELSPEVEEKETFGCWICEERMGFKKLVTHLRAHSQTEKMLAYTTQVTQERKERDGKNGKPRQENTPLHQGQDIRVSDLGSNAAEVLDSSKREDGGLSGVRESGEEHKAPKPLAVSSGEGPQGGSAEDIAKL